MGNFEKLSVLVIVVIIVMILVVALYTWTDKPKDAQEELASDSPAVVVPPGGSPTPPPPEDPWPKKLWEPEEEEEDTPTPPAPEPPAPTPPPAPRVDPPVQPEPEPPDPVVVSQGPWKYTIQSGDTISQICERELGSWRLQKKVMELNPSLDPLKIRPGQVIQMPPRGSAGPAAAQPSLHAPAVSGTGIVKPGDWYVIRRGDRLSTIAKRAYGSIERWPELWARNLSVVRDPDDLIEGRKIYIPK